MPPAGCVAFDEFIPGRSGSFGAGIEAVFLEDVADRAFGDREDPQFFELADNAGIAPVVFLGQFDDQPADSMAPRMATAILPR